MCLFIEKNTVLVLQGLNSNNNFFHRLSKTLKSLFKVNSISSKLFDACCSGLSSANNLQKVIMFSATSLT